MAETIKHAAKVEAITDESVSVGILQKSACAGCHAAGFCTSADVKERTVVVRKPNFNVTVGQEVVLEGHPSLGWISILVAFVGPLLVLLTSILISSLVFELSDFKSALFALIPTTLYFLIVFFLRHKLERRLVFTISLT